MFASYDSVHHPEDLSDAQVSQLRRLGFHAAVTVLERWNQVPPPEGTRLEYIGKLIQQSGVHAPPARRYAIAQAAQFLSQPEMFDEYVPPQGVEDEEWLRFMITVRGASDVDIAFQVARARGGTGMPDIAAVRDARIRLGVNANCAGADADTLHILAQIEDRAPTARDFLTNLDWLSERVLVRNDGEGLSDGDIARELIRVGLPCDRSTVRLYRKMHKLKRKGYSKTSEDE